MAEETYKLNCDIIRDILLRLDVKTLGQSKCVCKAWFSVITHPDFSTLYLKLGPPRVILHHVPRVDDFKYKNTLSVRNLERFDEISSHLFPIKMDEEYHRPLILMGSDKGLLCLLDYKDNIVYLWNPAIKEEFKALLSSPKAPREWKCTHSAYGFGYDPLTFDFKVVKVSALDENGYGNLNSYKSCNKVGVYSLRSNSWKRLTMPNIFSELESDTGSSSSDMTTFTTLLRCSLVVNGSVHWMICFGRSRHYDDSSFGIVAFDLSTEVFKLIKCPQSVRGPQVKKLGELSECLSFLTCVENGLVEVWVMKNYGDSDSWFKYLSVNLFKLCPVRAGLGDHCGYSYFPVGILRNGNVVLDCPETGYLCWYEPKNNIINNLCPRFFVSEFTTYVQSSFKLTG